MAAVIAPVPVVRASGEGERRWFHGGGVHTWKVHAEESAGAFLLFEDAMDQGKTTPLHTHPGSDETMVVLEGSILMHLDGAEHRVDTGGVATAPRGLPHAFMVISPRARLLCLHTPGSCEAFYQHASVPLSPGEEGSGAVDFELVRAAAAAYGGIEILGPPPFARPGG
jgi:quercetin dioxygenase-like cupin family protein